MKKFSDKELLNIKVKDGLLTMTVGIDLILWVLKSYQENDIPNGKGKFTVKNKNKFCEEIIKELFTENEDGSTDIHKAIENATMRAIENGSKYVSLKIDGKEQF